MMIRANEDHRFAVVEKTMEMFRRERAVVPLRLFHHRELLTGKKAAVINQKDLVNLLHHTHFSNGTVLVHVNDPQYAEEFLIRGRLDSCSGEELRCLWPEGMAPVSDKNCLLHLLVEDGISLLSFPIRPTGLDQNGFSMALPEMGYLLGKRRIRRHAVQAITAEIIQSGFAASGELLDFSPLAFRIFVPRPPSVSFIWMNPDAVFTICLKKGNRVLFTGVCRCLRQAGDLSKRELILAPQEREIKRFRKQKCRTPRLSLTPPPTAHFLHPLFDRIVHLDIRNLTFAGFVIEERSEEGTLMPGLIIHGLEIRYAETLRMTCDAQVIYRREVKKGWVRCGMAILDMDFRTYRTLSHIMVHAGDPQARFNSDVETDALWKFLFEANFIYPQKYRLVQSSREEFKDTYQRLCREDQEIEAHFTYQENGRIFGHVSFLRAYQRTWMWHHLAARPLHGKPTGLTVLKNIHRFCDGLYRYPSSRMDYMMVYFRPENHFPNLLFGGFARSLGNQRACSLDLYAYLIHPAGGAPKPWPPGWRLADFEARHLPELERFYRNASGGLLLDILQLGPKNDFSEPVEEVFRRHGFLRSWRLHALERDQQLKAFLIVNRSSPGLNLSEFLNCIKVIVTDPADLSWEILTEALTRLTPEFGAESVPLLVYPAAYPASRGIHTDKQYLLWILDTQYGKEYLEYMAKRTRVSLRLLLKYVLRKLVPR